MIEAQHLFPIVFLTLLVWCCGSSAQSGELTLTAQDLQRIGSGPLIAQDMVGLPGDPDMPAVDPADQSSAAQQLRGLVARGKSAGFGGILYDNRDRSHSTLPPSLFPDLTFLKYDQSLIDNGLDYGLAGPILIPALVFGNSSTARTVGVYARSLVRLAMTTPGGAARAYRDYISNSIYVYPEHRDHDAVDLYPANWPYTTISQGSSSSDAPFMVAVAMTLAAFSTDTRAALEKTGLIAPTVQMILRRNLKLVQTRAQYLSALAHPTVFDAEWLRPGRMIGQAAALRPEDIPPVVRLKVVEEDFSQSAGLAGLDEHLFTTPSAIARVWRSAAWQRQITLSAEPTTDPNGRELRFDWVLLRGNPDLVKIETLDPVGRVARITVNWHDAFVLPPRGVTDETNRMSSRVDIGIFAWNGRTDSAPAFVSISFPTHQRRDYEPAPDGSLRLSLVDYDAHRRNETYDPVLHWSAPWTDKFSYGYDGVMTGWLRDTGGATIQFDATGQPVDGDPVTYELIREPDTLPILLSIPKSREN